MQVFSGCRTPGIGKREAGPERDWGRDRQRDRERGGQDGEDISRRAQGNQPRPTTAAGTNLERLVKDVRSHIKEYRRYVKVVLAKILMDGFYNRVNACA